MIEKLPDELLCNIFKSLGLKDLAALSRTCHRLREVSLDTVKGKTAWNVTPQEVLRCPETYAIWFDRMPNTGLKIEDVLWSSWRNSDVALTVENIKTAQRMIQAGQLHSDFIMWKASPVWASLSSFIGNAQLSTVKTAVALLKAGIFSSLKEMTLRDIDVSSIPAEDLSALSSVVIDRVVIMSVTGDVAPAPFLNSIKSKVLDIRNMTLDHDATRALLTALIHGVEEVLLYNLSLDISVLTAYDGQGKCSRMRFYDMSVGQQGWVDICQWANKVGWNVKSGEVLLERG